MKLHYLQGTFTKDETLEILNQLLQVKIKFHEAKIGKSQNEEDIKMREQKIRKLQSDFFEVRQIILSDSKNWQLESEIIISKNEA